MRTRIVLPLLLLLLSSTAFADDAADKEKQRRILNEGYSILYRDARTLGAVKYLLWVKIDSEDYHKVVSEVADFGGELHDQLKKLPDQYPAVRVDLDPLPEMEKRKRLATGFDKFKDIAPLTGKSGHDYERVLLNSLTNGLNQERHLAEEMAKEEPDPGLKKFLQDTQEKMDRMYEKSEALMERDYFR